jgi:hypothetical protein
VVWNGQLDEDVGFMLQIIDFVCVRVLNENDMARGTASKPNDEERERLPAVQALTVAWVAGCAMHVGAA